jgi:hypothetical protein
LLEANTALLLHCTVLDPQTAVLLPNAVALDDQPNSTFELWNATLDPNTAALDDHTAELEENTALLLDH